jgi:1-acyl-sn-glycerol-3-phosphate acyltransferase
MSRHHVPRASTAAGDHPHAPPAASGQQAGTTNVGTTNEASSAERTPTQPSATDASPAMTAYHPARPVYRLCQWIVRTAWRQRGRIDVHGLHNIPDNGPFLLVCNHQSDLDPPLIHSVIRRPVHAVAKSALFAGPGLTWIQRQLCTIPVRRFQVDPQAVRTTLRYLAEGRGVAIYVEGERSWNGRLQPYRPGTIRLALKAGVPVIPAAIHGSYEASPRWDSRIRSGPVTIRFLQPITFPRLDRRIDRERALPAAADLIMSRIAAALPNGQGEA